VSLACKAAPNSRTSCLFRQLLYMTDNLWRWV
jgi:hypothetical protein